MLEHRTVLRDGSAGEWNQFHPALVAENPKLTAIQIVLRTAPLTTSLQVKYVDDSATEYRLDLA